MSTPPLPRLIGTLTLATLLTACGQKETHPETAHAEHSEHEKHEGHDDHEEGEAGASFDADHGLEFSPEVTTALGILTAQVETRALPRTLHLTAQIISTRAVAFVSPAQAAALKPGLRTTTGAELIAISRTAEKATGHIELIFTLPINAPTPAPNDTVSLDLLLPSSAPALTIPCAALLDTATGPFVYFVHEGHYRRIPVKIGATTADFLEITSGLSAGDTVVTASVNQLWLTELRLTKGGGHSH